MTVANLEYEIDHLEDFVPEIKVQKEKAYQEKLAKGEKDLPGKIDPAEGVRLHLW